MSLLNSIIKNKVVVYMATRYLTFGLQFVVYLFLANKLGPYYMGIWGYFLLLTNYFSVINFGMPNSITISLVHYKSEDNLRLVYEKSAFLIVSVICLCFALFAVVCSFSSHNILHKNELGLLFFAACFVGILSQYTNVFTSIARVKGHLMSISFSLSITVILMLLAVTFFSGEALLWFLGGSMILGNILSIFVFIVRKNVSFKGSASIAAAKQLVSQGFFLFLYTLCFQFILISTRTFVSEFYSVEQFGFFSFSYTVAHSVILLLEAVATLIFPKLVDKFSSKDSSVVKKTIKDLRVGYISTTHLLMYLVIAIIPLLLIFMPKYRDSMPCINLMALTLLLYSNSYGYNTYLMSNHKERLIARNSVIVLLINLIIGIILIKVFNVYYQYVLISTMLSYLVYSGLCVYYGSRLFGGFSFKEYLSEFFPLRLFIPFIIALIVSVANIKWLSPIPLLIFVVFNIPVLKDIKSLVITMIKNPKITDI